MKSTKIALVAAIATLGLALPGVAQERPNNERPQERPKKERPKTERPKTECPQETPQRGREEVERKKKERGGEERPQTRGDGDKPVNRERAQGGEAKPKFNKDEAIRMAKAEVAKHRERMAKLARLRVLAEAEGDRNKVNKIDKLAETELARHGRTLAKAKENLGEELFNRLKKELDAGKKPQGERPTEGERPKSKLPTETPKERG